jgi:hypothetical protein
MRRTEFRVRNLILLTSAQGRFVKTLKDPEFLGEAKKANLDINPEDGATLEQNVKEILKLEPALVSKLKEILK